MNNSILSTWLGVVFTCLAFSLLIPTISNAQSSDYGDRVMFIEIEELSPESYGEIAKAIKNTDLVEIKHACVPANIIMFTVPSTNKQSLEENYVSVKGMVMEVTDHDVIRIIAEYSEEDFIARCNQFRTGQATE